MPPLRSSSAMCRSRPCRSTIATQCDQILTGYFRASLGGEGMVSRRVPSLIKSIALAVPFLTLGASVGAPANSLRADECLSAPDSPSPQGTHWYYRLDLPTQRKCWYLRAPVRSLRRAAGAAAATPVPFGRRHSLDSAPISVEPGETASHSSRVDMLPIDRPTAEGLTATRGKFVQQWAQENKSAPVTVETPQASTLSQAGNDADGPPIAWPDPLPSGAAAQAACRCPIAWRG